MTHTFTLDLTTEQKTALKVEFEQLRSIEEKYNFWKEKLNHSYCLWAHFEQMKIMHFLIFPNTPNETETLNKLLYRDGQIYFASTKERKASVSKQKFIDTASESENKDAIIEYELKKSTITFFPENKPKSLTERNTRKTYSFWLAMKITCSTQKSLIGQDGVTKRLYYLKNCMV